MRRFWCTIPDICALNTVGATRRVNMLSLMIEPTEIHRRLLLSMQRALLGAVPAALREATCGWIGTQIQLRFVYDGEIDPDDYESARIVGSEVAADFPAPWTVCEDIVRIDYPTDLRVSRQGATALLAYQRKETAYGWFLRVPG
jgi:hypothetical protein